MLSSGPKSSYYEDFMRRKGTSRTLNDPPSLLTDRGAYVNFLEVQLERVSSACLSVQGYDQRFNDMQTLIVHLEEKVGTTTRLVSLAQECSERVKEDCETRISSLSKQLSSEHTQMMQLVQTMSERITGLEQSMTTLYGLFPRIESLEHRLGGHENSLRTIESKYEKAFGDIRNEIADFGQDQKQSLVKVEEMQSELSRHLFDSDVSEKKFYNLIRSSEDNLTSLIAQKISDVSSMVSKLNERMEFENKQQDIKLETTTSNLRNEISQSREEIRDEIGSLEIRITSQQDEKLSALESGLLEEFVTSQNGLQEDINNADVTFKYHRDEMYRFQQETFKQLQHFNKGLEEIGDITNKMEENILQETVDKFRQVYQSLESLEKTNLEFGQETQTYLSHLDKKTSDVDKWMKEKVMEIHSIMAKSTNQLSQLESTVKANAIKCQAQAQLAPSISIGAPSGNFSKANNANKDKKEENNPVSPVRPRATNASVNANAPSSQKEDNSMKELFAKFLDVYQNDRKDLEERLDRLVSSSSRNANLESNTLLSNSFNGMIEPRDQNESLVAKRPGNPKNNIAIDSLSSLQSLLSEQQGVLRELADFKLASYAQQSNSSSNSRINSNSNPSSRSASVLNDSSTLMNSSRSDTQSPPLGSFRERVIYDIPKTSRYLLPYFSRIPSQPPWIPSNTSSGSQKAKKSTQKAEVPSFRSKTDSNNSRSISLKEGQGNFYAMNNSRCQDTDRMEERNDYDANREDNMNYDDDYDCDSYDRYRNRPNSNQSNHRYSTWNGNSSNKRRSDGDSHLIDTQSTSWKSSYSS